MQLIILVISIYFKDCKIYLLFSSKCSYELSLSYGMINVITGSLNKNISTPTLIKDTLIMTFREVVD